MTEFSKGQRVHVEFDGTMCDAWGSASSFAYVLPDGHAGPAWLNKECVKITALGPEFWPPKPGDVWVTEEGEIYVAYESSITGCDTLMRRAKHAARPGVREATGLLRTHPGVTLLFRPAS